MCPRTLFRIDIIYPEFASRLIWDILTIYEGRTDKKRKAQFENPVFKLLGIPFNGRACNLLWCTDVIGAMQPQYGVTDYHRYKQLRDPMFEQICSSQNIQATVDRLRGKRIKRALDCERDGCPSVSGVRGLTFKRCAGVSLLSSAMSLQQLTAACGVQCKQVNYCSVKVRDPV